MTGDRLTVTTCNCDEGRHSYCYGYVAPLVYSNTRPCACRCHDGVLGRHFNLALRRAERSYYKGAAS